MQNFFFSSFKLNYNSQKNRDFFEEPNTKNMMANMF